MNDLLIRSTKETPDVYFNASSGVLKITGRAYSNDIKSIYKLMDEWLTEYLHGSQNTTIVELQIDYSNSVFNKLLLLFFEKCKTVESEGKKLIIKWHHEKDDHESVDDANRISKIIGLPVEKIPFE